MVFENLWGPGDKELESWLMPWEQEVRKQENTRINFSVSLFFFLSSGSGQGGRVQHEELGIRVLERAQRRGCRKTSVFLSRETGISGNFVGRIKGASALSISNS